MIKKAGIAALLTFSLWAPANSQNAQRLDTLTINKGNIETGMLQPSVNRYLVYTKNGEEGGRNKFQVWTRKIDRIQHEGKPAIAITQEWEDGDTVFHKVYSICDGKTMQPLFQDSWWKTAGNFVFDFTRRSAVVQGRPLLAEDTSGVRKRILAAYNAALDTYVLNWHLDLEVFSTLPYRTGVTFLINFYDPGLAAPQVQAYTVSGSAMLQGYDGQAVPCWMLSHKTATGSETFWVSKKTREVLKLEQVFNGKRRIKIKLPQSV